MLFSFRFCRLAVTAALVALFAAPLSNAQNNADSIELGDIVSSQQPDGILKKLRQRGQTALATVDEFGDPFIETSVGNVDYHIFFYGCVDHSACTSLALRAERMSAGEPTVEDVNAWNAEQRWTKVYSADANLLAIELDLFFGSQAMPAERFSAYLDLWDRSLAQFARFADTGRFDFVE